jgi:hypothetical protein
MTRGIPLLRRLVAAVGALLASAPASALEWEKREQAVRVAPLQTEVAVEFAFTNTGSRPVEITDIRTNCDCLDAKSERQTYAAGERGVIRARFSVGDRLGLYERSVLVLTDESPEPVRLAVKVDVPAPAEAAPRTVDWALNAPAEPRSIEITVAPELSIDFTDAISTGAGFVAKLEPLEPGKRYRVVVMPKGTAERASAAIRIRGTARSGQDIVVSAYAYVR